LVDSPDVVASNLHPSEDDLNEVIMAEHDDETLPLLTIQVPPLRMISNVEQARQVLQVTTDISVGGAQAIGGRLESLDLAID
jgi:hypothetical protein